MYELRDFNDGGQLLNYLNELGNHEVIHVHFQGGIWMVLVKKTRMGRPPRVETKEEPKPEVGSILSDYGTGFGRRDG